MRRNWRKIELPPRRWTATIVRPNAQKITTTIYGRTASEAEFEYEQGHPGERAIVQSEQTW